eukprot:479671-Amorphochlora_amoeboformis.AAC.2
MTDTDGQLPHYSVNIDYQLPSLPGIPEGHSEFSQVCYAYPAMSPVDPFSTPGWGAQAEQRYQTHRIYWPRANGVEVRSYFAETRL